MISRVSRALFSESAGVKPLSIAIFKLRAYVHDWERRKSLRKTLMRIPLLESGTNFIVIVTTNTMEIVMETAKELKIVDPLSKWLYIIADTNEEYNNISSVKSLIGEGENIAFAYNVTSHRSNCVQGISCHIGEFLKTFVLGLSRMIREEKSVYGQISDEEWEAIRPTKSEKRDGILKYMKVNLLEMSKCSNCTTWNIQAGEIWGNIYDTAFSGISKLYFFLKKNNRVDSLMKFYSSLFYYFLFEFIQTELLDDDDVDVMPQFLIKPVPKLLDVGYWKPTVGYQMTDFIFPHVTHGFRNKKLHIVTYHVRIIGGDLGKVFILNLITFILKNPPWQIITYNESGQPSKFDGVVIDILKELSKKLNFTYTLHVTTMDMSYMNETEELKAGNTSADIHLPTINIPTEIINIVGTNKVLLAAVGATVNERFKRILNFTMPISIQSYSFIVSRPRELSRIYLFLSPFAWDVSGIDRPSKSK